MTKMTFRTTAAAWLLACVFAAPPVMAGDTPAPAAISVPGDAAPPAAATPPAQAAAISAAGEYKDVPAGLLLTPSQRLEMQHPDAPQPQNDGDVGPDTSLDPQILTHSIKILEDKPEQQANIKIIGMPQIEAAYAQGKYADILHPLEESVDQNNPEAALLLGIMLDAGQGVAANPTRAAELYTKAAEANLPQAQHRLALQYYQGRGVAKDPLRAMMWLHIAAVTFKDGTQKQRVITDRNNLNAALSRRDRETALFMARDWLTKKGLVHLLDDQQIQNAPPQ